MRFRLLSIPLMPCCLKQMYHPTKGTTQLSILLPHHLYQLLLLLPHLLLERLLLKKIVLQRNKDQFPSRLSFRLLLTLASFARLQQNSLPRLCSADLQIPQLSMSLNWV